MGLSYGWFPANLKELEKKAHKVMEVIDLLISDNIKSRTKWKRVNKIIRGISAAIVSMLVLIHC